MISVALFASTVLIWGTTWLAIGLQAGPVPVMVSVSYRLLVAAVIFMAVLAATRRLTVPSLRHQPFIVIQALCLFRLNFLRFYEAEHTLPSGLVSVIISLATVFNAVNARAVFGDGNSRRTLAAAALGVGGLLLVFGPAAAAASDAGTLKGIGLAALGTLLFSLGNMASRRSSRAGVTPVTANAWGMAYGGLIMLGLIGVTRTPLVAPPDGRISPPSAP